MKRSVVTRLFSCALVFILALLPVLSALPAMEVEAKTVVNWRHVEAGSLNGDGHNYSKENQGSAAVLLHNTAKMSADGGSFSVTYEKRGRADKSKVGFFYTYVDDDNWLYIGSEVDDGKWYCQYKIGGGSEVTTSLSALPDNYDGSTVEFSAALSRETLSVNVNGVERIVTDQKFIDLAETAGGNGRIGFRAARTRDGYGSYNTSFSFTNAKLNGTALSDEWTFLAENAGQVSEEEPIAMCDISGVVQDAQGQPISGVRVRVSSANALTDQNGRFKVPSVREGDSYVIAASASGYEGYTGQIAFHDDTELPAITLTKKAERTYDAYMIGNSVIKAALSKTFPQVYYYEVMADGKKKTFDGQTGDLSTVEINGTSIVPAIGTVTVAQDHAIYPMTLQSGSINMAMTVKISVSENDLTWEVTEITKGDGCAKINTINVPNLNLITVSDKGQATDAAFMGAKISGNTRRSGDEEITFGNGGGFVVNNSSGYAYGFLSADGVSAGVWSNSEREGDNRLTRNNGIDTISLTSAPWYYDYNDENRFNFSGYNTVYDGIANGIPASELPCAKVCFTGDENKDGTVDWQDGAIAYRDIMNNPYGSENTKDLVNYRIVMNFSSQATNPFLKTADNIKKVYLATDGLPQAVMMKGYGSEGHDSANSEYGNVGERIGGLEELKKLNVIAHQYNTQTGIHINAQEAYPEAQTFSDALINGPSSKGWGWLDQSYTIDRAYDLGTGLRYKRLLQLYDQLNGTSLYANKWPGVAGQGQNETVASADTIAATVAANKNNPENLDFMYLDVWYGDSWETRKIAQQFNSLGWRFSTEFGYEGEYDSTWQHWATEGHYGGAAMKGLNSDVIRFIRNHQKDSFVLNWPSYGGAADNPLLGGYDLAGFEGWGSNNNFDNYMTRTFAVNLPTKFLQHYKVYKWENYKEGESPAENHEKQITLKSDDGKNTVVVTRNEKQRNDGYVERTITLNGKKILDDVTYLLPWIDSETKEEKLYHYNYDGGTTTWTLPDGWETLANVKIYKLTDAGRAEGKTVASIGGKVTLTAEADTPYIVLKGTADTTPKTVTDWSSHMHVTDSGFNSYAGTGGGDTLNANVWKGDITDVKVVRVESGNKYLQMGNQTSDQAVSTTITGLEAGQNYVAQVYVDNKSEAKAWIKVLGGVKTVSNYTLRSLAGNYVRCDAHNVNAVQNSKMQTMLVSFTAKSDTATLVLEREAGAGATYFDDIRIIKKTLNNIKENGNFEQDFETVVGGLYPFVMGPAQGVNDQVTHLSELHAPYSQSGWGNVYVDDVIEAEDGSSHWSLKHHGNNGGLIYWTIPQNLHFEEGMMYEVSFDYQAGHEGQYFVVVGDGDNIVWQTPAYLEKTAVGRGQKSSTQKCTFTMMGSATGQSWFGIYSQSAALSDSEEGETGYGYTDFILDNLKVKRRGASITPSSVKVDTAKDPVEMEVSFDNELDNNNVVTWSTSDASVAKVVPNAQDSKKCTVYFVGYGDAVISAETSVDFEPVTLESRISFPKYYELDEADQKNAKFKAAYANTESEIDNNMASKAIDGKTDTNWHSQYTPSSFTPSESNPAKLTIELARGENISEYNRVNFAQRIDNVNGLVQKYRVVVGNEFDSTAHEIKGTQGVDLFMTDIIDAENTDKGQIEKCMLPDGAKGKYLQIQVIQGKNRNACIAEVMLDAMGTVDLEAENGNLETNAGAWDNGTKAALEEAINSAKALIEEGQGEYSEASWTAFMNACTAAENGKGGSDAEVLTGLLQALKAAQSSLEIPLEAAKAALDAEMANAEKFTTQGNISDASWGALQAALAAARADDGTNAAKLMRLQQTLKAAQENLKTAADEELELAKKGLSELLQSLSGLYNGDSGQYSSGSWTAFSKKYQYAESNMESAATVDAINQMQQDLLDARYLLETNVQVAKKQLLTELDRVKNQINAGPENWTADSWREYTSVYSKAFAAVSAPDATVGVINGWRDALLKAERELETDAQAAIRIARQALSNTLSAFAEIKSAGQVNYSDESWNAFLSAYEAAEKEKDSADAGRLDALCKALTDAKAALKGLADGDTFVADGMTYQVVSVSAKTAKLTKGKDANKLVINTVSQYGVTYDVIEIGNNAFAKCKKKMKTITIGVNVTKIGKNAFKGCSKLATVKIMNKSKLKTVHKTAFKQCKKGISTKLPKSLKKNVKLKNQLKKAGVKAK